MDPQLTEALDRVTDHLAKSTEASNRAETTQLRVINRLDRLEHRVESIERRIDGSKPPPAGAPSLATSIARTGSQADLQDAAMDARLVRIEGELAKQSTAMGIGVRGLKWLVTPEGRGVALRLATLAAVIYVTFLATVHARELEQRAPAATVLPAPAGSR